MLRDLTKLIAKAAVATIASGFITNTLSTRIAVTNKLKIAEIAGSVGGGMIVSNLETTIDKKVDELFDRVEAYRKR